METEVIITGLEGIFTTIAGSWGSWFFARKKYDSEVDSNLIRNMQESLEFYKQLSDDNKERLNKILDRNAELESELNELRKQMLKLATLVCTNLACQARQNECKESITKLDGNKGLPEYI